MNTEPTREPTTEAPKEQLQLGTVIQGIVTIKGERYHTKITIGVKTPPISAIEHLRFVQARGNGQASDDTVDLDDETGVTLTSISRPRTIEAHKVAHGTHYITLGKVEENPSDDTSTENPLICQFKKRPCRQAIDVTDGLQSTWHLIDRLSNHGKTDQPIDTRGIGADYTYKQTSPRAIAEGHSEMGGQHLHIHSCNKCTARVRRDLHALNLIDIPTT